MELSERKQKILEAIIRNYMETGEPVGSRTVSKYTDLNLSSATIRNEMSDLEEMGYILQPHTSAGRIPSDKAYRLYVDTILEKKDQEVQEMKELMVEKADKIDLLLKQVAKLLAQNTNYTSMVTKPKYQHKRIKFIQLNPLDERQLLVIVVLDNNHVNNKVIALEEIVDENVVAQMNFLLNTALTGLDFTEINRAAFEATLSAHSKRFPCLIIEIEEMNEETFGSIFYFFQFACYISCSITGVNPFNQDGVEAYKNDMFKILGKGEKT